MKKIPYGESDFKRIQLENYYYIDKTDFIPKLEASPSYLYFLRPRRFGKSLLISMLEYYYDIKYKEQFAEIFKDTYILNNPTPLKNSLHIMKFDFSAVDVTEYKQSFKANLHDVIDKFIANYQLDFHHNDDNPVDRLNRLFSYCSQEQLTIYILIDEYDNFVNKLLTSNIEEYKGLVTTNDAFYKQFFTMLKVGTGGTNAPIRKMFFTGVSPLALFDITSGNNINYNISMDSRFNDMVGITLAELKQLIIYYNLQGEENQTKSSQTEQQIITRCNHWYNNYRFDPEVQYTIYNSDMILYYLNHLIETNQEPKELIDLNVRTDYTKLKYLVFTNQQLNGNFEMLSELIRDEQVSISEIKSGFSAFEMLNSENFGSLLFSLGLVTIEHDILGVNLKIPNQTIKKILAEFIEYAYKDISFNLPLQKFNTQLKKFAINKQLDLFYYLNEQVSQNSKIRDYIDGEGYIKGFLAAYLSLNPYYEVETEVEKNKGYADIILTPVKAEVPYGAIIELKYLSKTEYSEEKLQEKIDQATEQLKQYSKLDTEKTNSNNKQKYIKLILVYKAWELVFCEEIGEAE